MWALGGALAVLYLACQIIWIGEGKPPATWEYQSLVPADDHRDKALNALGEEGWELVGAEPIDAFHTRYVFKRAKP